MGEQTYESVLLDLARADGRLLVLTAENRAPIRGIPEPLGDRFLDFGICEQTMVGAAAGLALRGRIPVVHALATFLTMRAFEFIRTDIGIAGLPVILVGTVPGFLSEANGPTHQALEDVALMRGIPGMRVFCPSDGEDLLSALPHLIADEHPWYIRFNALPPVVRHTEPFLLGRAERIQNGDVVILTHGFLLREAVLAREALQREGISVGVTNMRTLQPVDEDAILEAARRARLVVTLEDHFLTGGLATIVAETLMRHSRATRVLPLALPRRWFRPGLLPDVLRHEGFSGPLIARKIAAELLHGGKQNHAEHRTRERVVPVH